MGKFKDLTGQKFNKLLVIKKAKNNHKRIYWICKCDCGNTKEIASCHLISGAIKDCGCSKKQKIKEIHTKHGKSNTRIFRTWNHMKDRCYRKNDKSYKNYGKRGIKVCDEWLDKENGFINFYNWAINNGYEETLTLDRIDVNGNYEPENCRWATYKEQANNTRRNHYITLDNETHTVSEWSRILNISNKTILIRLKRGWSVEKTLNTKVERRN